MTKCGNFMNYVSVSWVPNCVLWFYQIISDLIIFIRSCSKLISLEFIVQTLQLKDANQIVQFSSSLHYDISEF